MHAQLLHLGVGLLLAICGCFAQSLAAGPLDAKLDQYLELYDSKPTEADALLSSLEPQLTQGLLPDDHCRLLAYLALAAGYRQDFKAVEQYLQQADLFLQEHPEPDYQAELWAQKFFFYQSQQRRLEAEAMFAEIQRIAPKLENLRVRYITYTMLGSEYQNRDQYPEALQAYLDAYATLENYHHPRTPVRQMAVANSIIQLNVSLKNINEAKSLLKKAIEQGQRFEELHSAVPDLYRLQAGIEAEENNYPAAEQTLKRAIELAQRYPGIDTFLLHNNLGDALMKQHKLVEASSAFDRAYQIAKQQNIRPAIATAQFNKGYAMLLAGDKTNGAQLMAEMVELAEHEQIPDFEMVGYYQELADAYQIAQMPDKEAGALRKLMELNRRVFQAERDKQISTLQEGFSAQQKAREIAALKQQNALKTAEIDTKRLQQHVVMLLGVISVLGTSLLYLLYRKVRLANTKLKQANDQLAYSSTHDPLTGLLNRRSLHDYMLRRQAQGERRKPPVETDAFILLDIDFFKHINDRFGHQAGDTVLVEIGLRLKRLTRADDMVLRWGGEEFLLLLRRIDQHALEQFCQRVLNCIGQTPICSGEHRIHVTASAGFITLPFAELTEEQFGWEKALQLADMALYLGKVHGRNRAYGYKRLLQPYADIRHQLEHDLNLAIEQHQVEMTLILGPSALQ